MTMNVFWKILTKSCGYIEELFKNQSRIFKKVKIEEDLWIHPLKARISTMSSQKEIQRVIQRFLNPLRPWDSMVLFNEKEIKQISEIEKKELIKEPRI